MDALDGNAIAGALHEHFGSDMTLVIGVCGHCGARAPIAELVVYMRAPGAVVRCRNCGQVVMVLVSMANGLRIDLSALSLADPQL